jgi:acyl-CoA synthetase (AMP-forming)/AMP-acid ligase II
MTALAAASPTRTTLDGGPAPSGALSVEEIVRPFGVRDRGVTFAGDGGNRFLSYHELATMTAAVATRLRRTGVRRGDRVGLTLGNDLPSVLALTGIWAAGATVVSVPVAPRRGASLHARYFGDLLTAAGCAFLLTADPAGPHAAMADPDGPRSLSLADVCAGLSAESAAESDTHADVSLDGTALIQFTSGSVSAPKGVAVSAERLAGHMKALEQGLEIDGQRDRFVSWLPLYHDMGLLGLFLNGYAARAQIVLMQPRTFAFGPARWLTTMARTRGTVTGAPNFACRMAADVPYDEDADLSSVRLMLSGGERLNWQTLVDLHRTTEPHGLRWEALTPCYGMAESVVGTCAPPIGRGPVRGPDGHVSVGRPFGGLRAAAPDGPPAGPIQLAGDWIFDGYHTADGFTPTTPGSWYDTGDDGFIHDGELYVLGRRGEVVHAAGRNIFAEDIEAAVYDASGHGVKVCAAFRLGAQQQFGLMIEIPGKPADSPDALAVAMRAAVSAALGVRVHLVLVVRSGTIPRTTSGKVQRGQCRDLHARGELDRRLLATVT